MVLMILNEQHVTYLVPTRAMINLNSKRPSLEVDRENNHTTSDTRGPVIRKAR
jgi:hypothetical protein